VISSCKKYSEETMVLEVDAKNPVTGVPISGVKFQIYEIKFWGGGINEQKEESSLYYEGVTDSNGFARFEYNPMIKHGKKGVNYFLYFYYSDNNITAGNYQKLLGPDWLPLTFYDNYRKIDIHIVPVVNNIFHLKNVNCFDSNDKMKYRLKFANTQYDGWG